VADTYLDHVTKALISIHHDSATWAYLRRVGILTPSSQLSLPPCIKHRH
jgi:hypothetical protein